MALETLKDVKELGGFEVKRVAWEQPSENFIEINTTSNSITFHIQNGPIKEKGVNGCQVDTILTTVKVIVEGLNKNFPCIENEKALEKMTEALMWMEERKRDRVRRGVEGYDKK